ncbi:unnamed protein product, partial [Rangifer tarandus platyrhynchus]
GREEVGSVNRKKERFVMSNTHISDGRIGASGLRKTTKVCDGPWSFLALIANTEQMSPRRYGQMFAPLLRPGCRRPPADSSLHSPENRLIWTGRMEWESDPGSALEVPVYRSLPQVITPEASELMNPLCKSPFEMISTVSAARLLWKSLLSAAREKGLEPCHSIPFSPSAESNCQKAHETPKPDCSPTSFE